MLATLHWLSQGGPTLSIAVGSKVSIEVSSIPQQFESEISYDDPPTRKQRLLLPVPEHDQSTSTAGEDVEVEEDDEDTDEQESGEQ